MTKHKTLWLPVITAGFAIFSMFFGSGNLVFPIITGQTTAAHYIFGTLGFLVTDILVTFIGLLGVVLAQGNTRAYFKELPPFVYFLLASFLLSMMGPFYVVPRCIHVAFGGVVQLFPACPLWLFSGVFIVLLYFLLKRSEHVVGTLGKFLSPFKFGSILLITAGSLWFAPKVGIEGLGKLAGFLEGAKQGYQTMDLIAAFFFSASIYSYFIQFIDDKNKDGRAQLFKNVSLSCLMGLTLITFIYICFIFLGASYAEILRPLSPECYFPHLAWHVFGSYALALIAFMLFFSTFATALILVDIYITYLRDDIFQGKISKNTAVLLTLSLSYGLSLLGFTVLKNFFGVVLNYIYPVLIIFAIYKLGFFSTRSSVQ